MNQVRLGEPAIGNRTEEEQLSGRLLLDDFAIRNLCASYSHAVARLDAEAAAAVYTKDGVLSAFSGPELVGRDQIAQALRQTFAPLEFLVQTCSAGMVDINGDTGRASWSVSEWFRYRDSQELCCCFGLYEDQLVRQADGWRFVRRRFHPFYRSTGPSKGKGYSRPEAFTNDFTPWPFAGPAA